VPSSARLGTKYCSAACRAMAYRQRHKTVRAEQPPASLLESPTDGTETTENVIEERTPKQRGQRKRSSVNRDGQTNRNAALRRTRIAFVEQLRRQQPEGAAGYRLVLPARSPADTPKVVPAPDSQGGIRYWRLSPFEIPDDIRLQDGLSYRVVWVNAAGQPLAVMTPYVPKLDFFLGPPDSEQDERNAAYEAILRDVRDPTLQQSLEAEVARSRLALQRERERQEIRERQTQQEERLYRIHTDQIEDDRRRRREDRAEQERQKANQLAAEKCEQAARDERAKREMWTALKVVGGIAAAAAIGWGPFTKWLDSLQNKDAPEKSKNELAGLLTEALGMLKNGLPQLSQKSDRSAVESTNTVKEMERKKEQNSPIGSDKKVVIAPTEIEQREITEQESLQSDTSDNSQNDDDSSTDDQETKQIDQHDDVDQIGSLSTDLINELCACVIDPDLMTQFFIEQNKRIAMKKVMDIPSVPDVPLDKSDMKRVQAIVANQAHSNVVLQIWELFQRAKEGGVDALFSLPPPLPSLTEQDRMAMNQHLATVEQKEYFTYLIKRRGAWLQRQPMPPAQPLRLSLSEQKAIRRLSRDERALHYILECGLLQGASPQS